MKKIVFVLTVLTCLALIYVPVKGQIPAAYQVGTWQNFKTAAVSYTFDDNCSNQIPVAIPLLNNYGFKATIFAVTQNMSPNWTNMKSAANSGHEIASHTVTHSNLPDLSVSSQDTELKNSQATINTQITNQKCYTVAYPNCNIGDLATIQKYYIAGRTCSGQIIAKSPSDFYSLSSIICGNTGVNTAADMNTRVGNAKSSGGWCVFLIHGIDNDGGYSPLASSVLGSHLSYVNTNTADYWVAPFGNVVRYIKERNAMSITETTVNADSLRMTPTDNLDNTIYSVAVTIRRQLPSTWTTVRVMQGTSIIPSTIVTISGVKYIQFDVVPDKGVYTLANAATTTTGCTTAAPTVSPLSYTQGSTAAALTATGTALKWYGTDATGGTASTSAPVPSTATAGTTTYYVSQTLNNCEGPRAALVVTVTATGTTTSCGETGNGAYYTGVYRNMFKELLNKTDTEVNAKVDAAFQQLFYGSSTQKVYYEVGTDMAYIQDIANNDVRTEGMSYGMMICVQLNKQAEFNKIWKWAKTYMQYGSSSNYDGYFAWQCNTDGSVKGNSPASDGEAYFITALLFAENRWGNGTGINNYGAEAQNILTKVMSKTGAGSVYNLFNANSKLITFVPYGDSYTYTDPSYNLPGFFELWSRWSDTNTAFWQQTPGAARQLIRNASNATSGLTADYANFDGTPKTTTFNSDSHRFMYDAWRTIMNLGMDYHWFQADAQQPVVAERYLTFFKNQGTGYKNHYDWNGANAGGDHSTGLVACNAVASLAVNNATLTTPFVQEFWNVGIPSGTYRYYDGMLYMLALLNCSGNFKIWKPACAGINPVVNLTAPANNATYAAGANVTLTATATDADGTITKVEFYNGTTLLATVTASPYTYIWNAVAQGNYVITAAATDNSGNKVVSAAANIVVGNPTTELINNGEFDNGTTGWTLQNNSGATGTMSVVTNGNLSGTNSLRICPSSNPGTLEWHVQVSQAAPITAGKNYQISVMAKADAARQMTIVIQQAGSPYTTYFSQVVSLTTAAQTFTFTYSPTVTDATAQLKFYVGADATCLNIDKVSMGESNFQLTATITAATATTFCAGGSVVLNANTGTGYTYQWNKDAAAISGATAASYTATQAGSYTVAVTANSQTVTSAATTVTVNAAPAAPTVTATVSYCVNAPATQLTATGTALKWYADNTTTTALSAAPTPVTTAAGTTNYYVSQTITGCESSRAQIAVTVNAAPSAPTVTAAVSYCVNATATQLTATGTALKWYADNTTTTTLAAAPTPVTTAAGVTNYYVSQTITGCESPRAQIAVTVNTLPTAAITSSSATTFCTGGSTTLTSSTGSSYIWKNGTTQVGTASSYTATTAGSYTVEVTNANGCKTTSAATNVTVNTLPAATIAAGGATTFCDGGSVALTSSVGSTYIWKNGTTQVGTAASYTATTAGSYTVEVTNANGCKATSAATIVTVNALPTATITAGGSTTFCTGGSTTLTASAGSSYIWKNGTTQVGTASSYTVTTAGSYTVEVTNANGCKATSDATTVTVNAALAPPTVSSPVVYCQNATATALTATGTSLKWYADNTTTTALASAPVPSTASAGTTNYYVSQTNGCESTRAQIAVTVNALPTAAITAGGATTFCDGGSVTLTSSAGSSYIWKNGTTQVGTAASYTASTSGSYTVEVTNAGGCKITSAATTVTVNALPTATITAGGATTFCTGGSVVLTSSAGSSYIWRNGTIQVGTAASYTATAAGSYAVEVTNANGCKATSAAASIIVNTIPNAPAVTSPVVYCQNATATALTATGTALKWYADNTTTTALASAPVPSTASVGITNYYVSQTNGCESARAVVEVTVNALPSAVITPAGPTAIPAGGSVVLNANTGTGLSYIWFNGSGQVGTGASYTATATGAYTVEVTNGSGCKATSLATDVTSASNQPSVITITSPTANATIDGAITITATVSDPDGSITLVEFLDGNTVVGTSTTAPYSFNWTNPGAGSHTITVRVTDSNGGITTSAPVTITSSSTSGVNYSSAVSATVYPNPSSTDMFVETDMDLSDAHFTAINVLGEEAVLTSYANATGARIDISNLTDGTYVLIITDGTSVLRKKITVIK